MLGCTDGAVGWLGVGCCWGGCCGCWLGAGCPGGGTGCCWLGATCCCGIMGCGAVVTVDILVCIFTPATDGMFGWLVNGGPWLAIPGTGGRQNTTKSRKQFFNSFLWNSFCILRQFFPERKTQMTITDANTLLAVLYTYFPIFTNLKMPLL